MPHPMGPINHRPIGINSLFNILNISTVQWSTLPEDLSGSLNMCSTGDHTSSFPCILGRMIVPMDRWSCRQLSVLGSTSLYMFSTHVPLHGNNLNTTSRDPTTHSYPLYMGRETLRSRSLNSKSSLQGKLLHSRISVGVGKMEIYNVLMWHFFDL